MKNLDEVLNKFYKSKLFLDNDGKEYSFEEFVEVLKHDLREEFNPDGIYEFFIFLIQCKLLEESDAYWDAYITDLYDTIEKNLVFALEWDRDTVHYALYSGWADREFLMPCDGFDESNVEWITTEVDKLLKKYNLDKDDLEYALEDYYDDYNQVEVDVCYEIYDKVGCTIDHHAGANHLYYSAKEAIDAGFTLNDIRISDGELAADALPEEWIEEFKKYEKKK